MSVIYINEANSTIFKPEEENMYPNKSKIKKKNKAVSKMPYGRKRSCWKKKHSAEETPTKSVAESGVITCAICGIQRYYKFLKQTKKFGLHSCEPCRKFISSMILYVKNNEQLILICPKKGSENCLYSENFPVRNGATRSKKDALSNMRCKACWLAQCLEKYEMPMGLKNSLAQFISDDRSVLNKSMNSFTEIDYKTITKRKSQTNSSEEELKTCMKTLAENYIKAAGLNKSHEESKKKIVILRIKC